MWKAIRRTETGVKTTHSRTCVGSWLDHSGVDICLWYATARKLSLGFRLSLILGTRQVSRSRFASRVENRKHAARGKRKRKERIRTYTHAADRFDTGDKVLPDFGPVRRTVEMLKQLQMGMRAFLLMASRVWTCICFLLKKQVRAVSRCFAPLFAPSFAVRHESYYEPSNRRADGFGRLVGPSFEPRSALLLRYRYRWYLLR